MQSLATLIDAICEAYDNELYRSHDITGDGIPETFCNQAVNYVTEKMGFLGFKGLTANEMIDLMEKHPEIWNVLSEPLDVYARLVRGTLIIAGLKDDPHGHVCVLRPGEFQFSTKWKSHVPKCLNIGKSSSISTGVNFAFKDEPKFYVYMV